jgi:hypothetical protein
LVLHDPPKNSRRGAIACLLVLAVLTSILVVRVRYGIEYYGDEAYAIGTPMRYVAGDHPIVDSWESHFSSGMLLTPFVWAIEKAAPNREGIILDFRYLFVAMQALYAFAVWRLLRRVVSEWWAIAIAGAVFAYLPYFYVWPHYNNMAIAAFTVSTLMLLRAFSCESRPPTALLVGAGVLGGLGTIAYPTMALALPLFAVGIGLESRARGDDARSMWRSIGLCAAGAGLTLAAFAGVTVWASGWRELAQAWPNFANPVDRDLSLAAIAFRFWRTKPIVIGAIGAAVAFFAYIAVRGRQRASAVTAIAVMIGAAVVVTSILYRFKVPWLTYIDMEQACAFGVGLAVPLLALVGKGPAITGRLLRLLCLPAIGVALGTALVSHEGFETFTMPAIILVVATLVALAHAIAERPAAAGPARPPWRTSAAVAAGALALVAAFFFYSSMQYVAGDDAIRQLGTQLTSGPYKGVVTSTANAERYVYYSDFFGPMQQTPGRIAFVEEFPLGYLLTGRRPGTYSVWTTYARGDRWQRYIDVTGNYPTTIVSTRIRGYGSASDAEKIGPAPIPPPFGLRDFAQLYREQSRNADFVVYQRVK